MGRVYIDLGNVQEMAAIKLNGKEVSKCWISPYRADISDYLKTGKNLLEIDVTNLWVNRLIGDLQPDVKQKITFVSTTFYKSRSSLLPSGLLGPVKIILTNK